MLWSVLRDFLVPYRRWIAAIVVLQLIQAVASLYLPGLNASIIDQGIVPGDAGHIGRIGAVMLGVTIVQMTATIAAVYCGARTAMSFGRDVRAALFDTVQSFAAREMAQFGAPTLITRSTNDVQQIQMLVFMTFTFLVTAPLMGIGGIVMALRQDVPLSTLVAVVLPTLVVTLGLVIRRMRPLFRTMQSRLDTINATLREQIAGVRVIRAFVREADETARFATANTAFMDVAIAVGRLMALLFPLVMIIMNASVLAATWFGAIRVESGAMEVGTLTAFQNYLVLILMAVMMATFMLMILPRAEVSAERIREVLATEPSVSAPTTPVSGAIKVGRIAIRDGSFSYPNAEQPVLTDVSLRANPGEVTAIIGSTGSGKSTLLNLIPRLFDVTGGAVGIDDIDVRDLDPQTVWAAIGLVPQKPYLFSGTIASNLRYGNPHATDEELWAALDIAQASEFVRPIGLDAPVAQGGTNFSGGQRQRLAIARAVVKRPKIFLFDDSFSALDYTTDMALRTALSTVTADATVVIVAQRVNTIRDADRIVVLNEGRVVGEGKHHELMETNAVYREIVLSQLSLEEAS